MYLIMSNNVTISDNDFMGGVNWGIYAEMSHYCTYLRNTISYCGDGITLASSSQSLIKECTLERNTNGLSFDTFGVSSMNVVEFCEFRDNVERGIVAEGTASRCRFRWNVFVNNTSGAVIDSDFLNIFDYNYYDTYVGTDVDGNKIGDFPHPIPGTANNEDLHPLLLYPLYPEWDSSPADQNIEFGNDFSYNLPLTVTIPIGNWHINDTTHFVIDETGTIKDINILDVGTYPIDIVATNVCNLAVERSFTITVEDSVNPVWISQIQDKSYSIGEDIEIQVIAWDLAGIDSWEINDSTNFSITSTSSAETSVETITGIDNLPVGEYSLTITAYHPSGN